MRKLDGKSCPGQVFCTSNRKEGEIAGVKGRAQGYTLQNHCHNEEVTPFGHLKEGCRFFDTKPENVPQNLLGAIQTAEEFRELKELNLLPKLHQITGFEFECYRTAENASRVIEAEAMEEASNGTQSKGMEKIGDSPTIDSAFGAWDK